MCRPTCTTSPFHSLPEIPGVPGYRVVHGAWMDEEEYRVTGWHSRGTYQTAKGETEHIWVAPLGGHILWAQQSWQRREQRITAAQTRRQADDEWSDNVVSMIEGRDR